MDKNLNTVTFLSVGAGPASLMAAVTAAKAGVPSLILEKGPEAGRKLCLSGGGRGNFCNTGCWSNLEALSRPVDKKRLRTAEELLPPEKLRHLFAAEGLPSVVEDEGRVFPKSQNASDIRDLLLNTYLKAGGRILYEHPAKRVESEGKDFRVICRNNACFKARFLLLAPGAASYPQCGSSGDALEFFDALGLKHRPFRPALSPLRLKNPFPPELEGLSLQDAALRYKMKKERGKGTVLKEKRGPVMWQRRGLSGPLILNASADLYDARIQDIALSFLPEENEESLKKLFNERRLHDGKKQIRRELRDLLPNRLADYLLQHLLSARNLPETLNFAALSKTLEEDLIHLLLSSPLIPDSPPPLAGAMACRGGLDPDETDWRSMGIKKYPGLYAAGECMDIDFISGGYHLCFAFQSGYLAARDIIRRLQ